MAGAKDSHFPNNSSKHETGPIPQHKRAALGENPNGQTNPNGAESGPMDKKVANAPVTY